MPTELTPKWKPIPFPYPSIPAHGVLFDPVVCNERAVLVAGGPEMLGIFQLFVANRLWFSVKARVWITGFSVSASSLYVQDGPVLSGWDLTQGGCFAAINLVTKKTWAIPPDATPATQPPEDLYKLPAGMAELQSALISARTAQVQREEFDETLLAVADDTLASATNAAASLVFSAPVVRAMQLGGQAAGEVFSLGLDGTVFALDDALTRVVPFKYEAPLRAELALSEVLQPSGNVLCHLHYVTQKGEIASLDAMKNPLVPLPKWNSVGALDPAKVLPLRFQDGLLWGGGILGADFFATVPDPSQPLLLKVPAPKDRWQTYDISPVDKLVLVSNYNDTRLVSYDKSSNLRDRWRLRTNSATCHTVFWAVAGLDTSAVTPRLSIEVGRRGLNKIGSPFRVLLANTVDAPKPSLATNYPPPVQPIHEGAFSAGAFPTLQTVISMVCKPIVVQQTLYCVIVGNSASAPTERTLVLAAYALGAESATILPKATTALADLHAMVQPLRLQIMRTDIYFLDTQSATAKIVGPNPVGNTRITLALPTGDLTVETDALGIAELDAALVGQQATVNLSSIADWNLIVRCSTATLERGQLNSVEIHTGNRRWD